MPNEIFKLTKTKYLGDNYYYLSFQKFCTRNCFEFLFDITTVYKAGFSTLDDLYLLVTKNITKYPVLTTYKF